MQDDSVTVRPYHAADQDGIEWLYARTPPWGRTYPRPEPIPDDIRRISETFEYVVVAVEEDEDGEAVVGLATAAAASATDAVPPPPFFDFTQPIARLHRVLVVPERWRRGIGRRLVQDALEWARRHGYQAVILDTTSEQEGAIAFYSALGFREAGRTKFRQWEIVWFGLRL